MTSRMHMPSPIVRQPCHAQCFGHHLLPFVCCLSQLCDSAAAMVRCLPRSSEHMVGPLFSARDVCADSTPGVYFLCVRADIEPWRSIEPFKYALVYYKDALETARWIWAPPSASGLFQNVVVMSRLFSSPCDGNATLVVVAKDLVMIEVFDITSESFLSTRSRHGQVPTLRASIGGFLSVVGEFTIPLIKGRMYDLRFNVFSFMHLDKRRGILFALYTPDNGGNIVSDKHTSVWSRAAHVFDS